MKLAKSYKLLALMVALMLSVISAVCLLNVNSAKAASILPDTYFTLSGSDALGAMEFDSAEKSLAISAKEGQLVATKNKITFNDTAVEIKLPEDILKVDFIFNADSYDINGFKKVTGSAGNEVVDYITSVENKLSLESTDGATYNVKFNETAGATKLAVGTDRIVKITYAVSDDGVVSCNVNGIDVSNPAKEYKVKNVDKVVSTFAIKTIEIKDGADCKIHLRSINTKASEGATSKFNQTFELNADKTAFAVVALPRVALNDNFFSESKTVIAGREYTVTLTPYAVVNTYSSSDLKITPEFVLNENAKILKFKETGSKTFEIKKGGDVCEKYNVNVINREDDVEAPKYQPKDGAVEAFKDIFYQSLFNNKDVASGIYVRLGTNEYLTLPSMASIVGDNACSYGDLTYTVHYKTPSNSSTYTSGLKIPLTVAGEYKFFVTFKDKCGNEIPTTDFITTDENGNETTEGTLYGDYVFSFTILDNSVMEVKAAMAQAQGYIGVSYTATGFDISATGYTTEFKLFYSESDSADAEWVRVYKASEVEEDYSENGFTAENLKAIAYDGALTFTPDRVGFYKIECTVSSSASSRAPVSATTTYIKVLEEPTVVEVDNHWFENNIWSVVFLGVGTLCLVGIIVLLCIKPKTEEETIKKNKRK